MTEIGPMLREARIRQKVDISVVEERTKIRAKYLRALENEEWALLPGATFARTFLRTYSEFLGLDSQLLVDEYRRRATEAPEAELFHYSEPPLHERIRPPRVEPRGGRGLLIGFVVVALLGFLALLGLTGGSNEAERTATTAPPTATTAPPARRRAAPAAKRVRAQIIAAAPVWVCLVDDRGRRLIDAEVLAPGRSRGPFRAKRMKVTFGNGSVNFRVNGRAVDVPATAAGVGYELTPKRVRRLGAKQRPSCA